MKSCVVFASWIPKKSIKLGKYYLDTLAKYHRDSDIYLGINYGSAPEWVDLAWKSELNIHLGLAPRHKHVNSDVAGFVEGLNQLRNSGKKYDVIWFAHTKGASYRNFKASQPFRDHFEKNFWSKREEIEHIFAKQKNIGVVANELMINRYMEHNRDTNRLSEFYPFKYQTIGYFVVSTYFAMRGSVVHEFIDHGNPDFFRKNLVSELGFSRWFFEANFHAISDRMGYEPLWLNTAQDKFLIELEKWRKDKVHHKATPFLW